MALKIRFAGLLFFLAILSPAYAQICDCVSTGNCPVPITDNGTFEGTLDVTTNGPNDLDLCPLTSVCFTITHTWIGDLSVSLTSPSGVSYIIMADENNNFGGCGMQEDNIDVCIVLGDNNPIGDGSSNYSCNAGPCPAGVCCLTGDYTVACGGVTDPITGFVEAPNCDLDDFNVPGDPTNGTWTLTVNDVCNMDTGTLDNFSLNFQCGIESCIVCDADGGNLDSIDVLSCYGNPNLLLNLPPNYDGVSPPDSSDYLYGYIISQGGTILEVDSLADLTNQPAGTYQVHGLSYHINDTADINAIIGLDTSVIISQLGSSTAPFCGGLSSNWVTVTIAPEVPAMVIDTIVCEGDCIVVGGQTICSDSLVTLSSWLGCDSTIDVTLTPILPDTVALNASVCVGGCIDVGGAQYCAPGPYFVTLASWQGCDSVVNLTFNEIPVIADISPINPPALTCTNGSVVLDGSGSSASVYDWTGPGGFTSDQASVTVTVPGTYDLTVTDNSVVPPCTATTSVVVADGIVQPDLIVVGAAPEICAGETFDLASLSIQDQNTTNPIMTFHSGTPADGSNELSSTVVSPASTTTYYVLGINGSCSDETSVVLTINDLPTADFTAAANICLGDQATITYTGNATPGAIYNWDFDGGNAVGSGAGPYQVDWASSGIYTISLAVEENGCTSTSFTQTITVEDPIASPLMSCTTTTSSVEFTWPNVAGATGYNVTVISGDAGVQNGNSYLVTGLNPGDAVTIEVEAIGTGICGNSTAQQNCVAQDCPTVTIDISPVADICASASTLPFDLSATTTGGGTSGTLSWAGNGITDPAAGTFDPNQAVIGTNTITATYQEDNCIFTQNIDINVFQTPEASMIVQSPLCEGEQSIIVFNGTAEPGSIYTWDFDGGITSDTGVGPYQISWATAGTKTITLTVTSTDGCISTLATETVVVEGALPAPTINCSVSTSSVLFTWNDVGAASYNVTVLSAHTGTMPSSTSYEVTGLVPGEQVDIEVEAINGGICGNTNAQQSCQAQDCPTVTMVIDPVSDICLDNNTAPFNLTATTTGDTPSGIFTWTGAGITDVATGMFDPSQAALGINTIILTYEESTCFYSESIDINIFQTPIADFTAASPICAIDESQITYTGTNDVGLTYNWDFDGGAIVNGAGAGPYEINWPSGGTYTVSLEVTSADGCISDITTQNISVEDPLGAPVLNCSSTTSSVTFSWNTVPGGVDYQLNILTGQTANVPQGNSVTISGLQPGEAVAAELVVTGNANCPAVVVTSNCNADDCPIIAVDVDEVPDFCLGTATPIQLVVDITGSNGSGTGTWIGNGITDASTGIFDPNVAGFGGHLIKYSFSELGCVFEDSIIIGVYQQPTANFSADAIICIADAATVTFSGVADVSAVYNWDFDGGVATPGSGAGPHQVVWDTPGSKTISLSVEQFGCISQTFDQLVQVDASLEIPNIVCNATTESIDFVWNDVPGATDYNIVISPAGLSGTGTGPTSYQVFGLDPGQQVFIEVTPVGSTSCPIMPASTTCNAEECLDINLSIVPVGGFCLDGNTELVTLQADISGSPNPGQLTWSGPGVIDPQLGTFDPNVAGEGTHVIRVDYQLVNCFYADEIEIRISPPPIADAGPDGAISCWESEQIARLGGELTSTGTTIVYQWSADNGSLPDNANQKNTQVSEPGTYTLVVTDTELGCSSSDDVVIASHVDMPEPVVSVHQNGCQGDDAAYATVDAVNGGASPFFFSLNGEPFVETDTFPFLEAGDYDLAVIDAAGCENEIQFTVNQSTSVALDVDLTANLVGTNLITAGESIQLIAISSVDINNLDSIVWSNPEFLDCTQCLDPMATPATTTTFEVTLYANGCEISDNLLVFVEHENAVYVPNAFSPNGDGANDTFMLYAGPEVERVKTFLVFDRWGEMVYEYEDFVPGDPAKGWDGTLDGRLLNPAVFVWFAEVEFADGSVKMLEGDVVLVR